MELTNNESTGILWLLGSIITLFGIVITWIINKGVNKIESISGSLINMEKDFKVLVNDHVNLKEDVKEIDKRVQTLEKR
jgi:hypothetical protein